MLNLYWKTDGQTRNLTSRPFETESEFEKYVFDNQDLLGDVYIIHRQVRTGTREGIPDMLGVDNDARVCVIEMKNAEVSEDVLPQVLSYAIWAETNPDSIKAIWLETPHKPEDIQIDWDAFEVRAIIIAPSFRPTVTRMARKIGYPIDLFQIQRFCFEGDEFLLVEVLEEEKAPRTVTTKYRQEWDWEFYESEHGKHSTEKFKKAVTSIKKIIDDEGWGLPYNVNKYYTGFKLGNRLVVHVAWAGTHAWGVRFSIPKSMIEDFKPSSWELKRYQEAYKTATYNPINPESFDVVELRPLIVAAYKHVSGLD